MVRCSRIFPSHHHVLGIQSIYILRNRLGDYAFCLERQLRQILVGLHLAEILLDDSHHLVGIEITAETDCHVVRNVVCLVIFLDIGDRRVLQVLLGSEDSLCAIRMVREKHSVHSLKSLSEIACQRHVLLLVHGFELSVEASDHRIHEPVGLDACPVLDLVCRDVLHIDGHVSGCICICAVRADQRHQLVIFVRNEIV